MKPSEFKEYLKKSKLSHICIHETKEETRKGIQNDGRILTSKFDYFISPKNIKFQNLIVEKNNDLSDHSLIKALITWETPEPPVFMKLSGPQGIWVTSPQLKLNFSAKDTICPRQLV